MNCSYKTLPSRMRILWDQAQDTRKSERKILKSTYKYSRQRKLEMKKQGNYPSGIWVTVAILDVITVMFLNGFCENIPTYFIIYNLIQSKYCHSFFIEEEKTQGDVSWLKSHRSKLWKERDSVIGFYSHTFIPHTLGFLKVRLAGHIK